MRLAVTMLSLSALFVSVATASPHSDFRDFSTKGPEYRALENLRFAAADATYSGSEQIEILGKPYLASEFSLETKVNVQTMCAVGPLGSSTLGTYEVLPAKFEVYVVEDSDRAIHNELVQAIYDTWSRKETFSGKYFYDFSVKDNHYVISALPDLVNMKNFFFIWVNGRVIKVEFKGFLDKTKNGWGAMDSFDRDNLRIHVEGAEFLAYQPTGGVRKQFIKLYREGFFHTHQAELQNSPATFGRAVVPPLP